MALFLLLFLSNKHVLGTQWCLKEHPRAQLRVLAVLLRSEASKAEMVLRLSLQDRKARLRKKVPEDRNHTKTGQHRFLGCVRSNKC